MSLSLLYGKENMFGLEIANAEFDPEFIEGRPYTKGAWLGRKFQSTCVKFITLFVLLFGGKSTVSWS